MKRHVLTLDERRSDLHATGKMGFAVNWPLIWKIATGALPLVIASIVAWVAIQQWVTAKNKLALDLFDRRFAAWTALDGAFEALMEELSKNWDDCALDSGPTPASFALIKAQSQTRFLFGDDFRDKLSELVIHLGETREFPSNGTMFLPMNRHAMRLKWELEDIAERYMMLKNIGVAKPKTPMATLFLEFTEMTAQTAARVIGGVR